MTPWTKTQSTKRSFILEALAGFEARQADREVKRLERCRKLRAYRKDTDPLPKHAPIRNRGAGPVIVVTDPEINRDSVVLRKLVRI